MSSCETLAGVRLSWWLLFRDPGFLLVTQPQPRPSPFLLRFFPVFSFCLVLEPRVLSLTLFKPLVTEELDLATGLATIDEFLRRIPALLLSGLVAAFWQ